MFAAILVLAGFGQLIHRTQATRTDVYCALSTVYDKMATLDIENEATACAMLRKGYIVSMHWLTFTYLTTACWHIYLPIN